MKVFLSADMEGTCGIVSLLITSKRGHILLDAATAEAAPSIAANIERLGFKLSDGMEVPEELGSFKFARQKSKLAGTIRGSYFVIKKEH